MSMPTKHYSGRTNTRPRVLCDGVTPKGERDARLMAENGDAEQAAIIAEFERSPYFRVMPFTAWRRNFRNADPA